MAESTIPRQDRRRKHPPVVEGSRYGRWTVIERAETQYSPQGVPRLMWWCRCDCGTLKPRPGGTLASGGSRSCGCLQKDTLTARNLKTLDEVLQGKRRWGRLTFIREQLGVKNSEGKQARVMWCRCDCGKEGAYHIGNLRRGSTQSCGCYKLDNARAAISHGHNRRGQRASEYAIWAKIKDRCQNQRCAQFADYGGRGIQIDPRWVASFSEFIQDVGPRPSPAYSLDRIDNDGHYEPGNVRWATRAEQARNTRRNLRFEFRGALRCLAEIAELTGTKAATIRHRLGTGLAIEDCVGLTPPLGSTNSRRPSSIPSSGEAKRVKHGQSKTPEYRAWISMRHRCYNQHEAQFPHYGGRGIKVCEEWLHDFPAFLKSVGHRPSPRHSLDRVDVDGDYEPENVRWALPHEQMNNRRNTVFVNLAGEKLPVQEAARRAGMSAWALTVRSRR